MAKDKQADPTHIKDLRPDPKNARTHTPRNIGMIADSLQEVGAARSIVIDEDDIVLAGNGTLEGAAQAGITKVRVVDASGDELIAVRRRGLTPEQKTRLALADNRTNELSDWNPDALKDLQASGADLSNLFTAEELADIIAVDDEAPVERTLVERPSDVAWVLLAIPLEEWPKHQAAVEAMQLAAKFSTMVMRPADGSRGVVADPKAGK
jgi:hypothetical protein